LLPDCWHALGGRLGVGCGGVPGVMQPENAFDIWPGGQHWPTFAKFGSAVPWQHH